MEKLLTADQLAELLQVKLSTIYQWTHAGFVPFIKIGRFVRFREDTILKWLKQRENQGRSKYRVRVSLSSPRKEKL